MILGHRIIASPLMTMPGKPVQVPRSWRERLFSLPWRPLVAFRLVVPQVPRNDAIILANGTIVVHPVIAKRLREATLVRDSGAFPLPH